MATPPKKPVESPMVSIRALFEQQKDKLAELLPKFMTPDRFLKVALNSISKTPKLMEAKPMTLFKCLVTAAELGLEPGGALGHAYLVPFDKNTKTVVNGKDVWTKTTEVNLIIGYQGFIDLSRRSGMVQQLEAHAVYENDKFEVAFGLEPKLVHVPCLRGDPGPMYLAYVVARLKDGGVHVEVMTKDAIDKIRARSKAGQSGPWVTDYDEMAKKTVVRRAMKYIPKSVELTRALEHDNESDGLDEKVVGTIIPKTVTPPKPGEEPVDADSEPYDPETGVLADPPALAESNGLQQTIEAEPVKEGVPLQGTPEYAEAMLAEIGMSATLKELQSMANVHNEVPADRKAAVIAAYQARRRELESKGGK